MKWKFDGFRSHLQRVVPADVERSPDGRIWTCRFDGEVDLAEVIVGEPPVGAFPEPKAVERFFEKVVVEFSSDGFKMDIRAAPSPPKPSYRILGPRGKSYFYVRNLLIFPGMRCKAVRVRLVKWRKSPNVKPFIGSVEFYSTKRERAEICRLFTSDLNGDGRREVIALTRDNQLVVLNDEGEKLWEYTFRHRVISLEALDVNGDGQREILACDAASYLYRFAPDGSLEGKMHLSTSEDFYKDFFRFNRAYSMGVWQPGPDEPPALILGTYQSIAWITSGGQIIWRPPGEEFKLPTQSGYLWRGLVYWEKVLPNGIDLNGDGTMDQVFMSYGWGGARPSVIFFDGARRDAMAEYEIPNGRPIGLKVIRLPDGHRAILAINEFHLGLYSTEGAKELWRVRFDIPAAAYAILNAQKEVYRRGQTWYFLHMRTDDTIFHSKVFHPSGRKDEWVVSIVSQCGDFIWETMDRMDTDDDYVRSIVDRYVERFSELIEAGIPVVFHTHWQSLFSNGRRTGLRVLEEIGKEVRERWSGRVRWTKCSDLAREVVRSWQR